MCALAVILGWLKWPVAALDVIPYYTGALREAGWSVGQIRFVLLAEEVLLGPVPYIVGCWLIWRLARSKASRLAWLPVALGGVRFALEGARYFAVFALPAAARSTILEAVGYYHLGGEVLLTAGAITMALEPYVSMKLRGTDARWVAGFTVLATLLTLFGWVIDALYYPAYLVALSAYSMSAALGFRSDAVSIVAQTLSVTAWWLVVSRVFVNWRRHRGAAATGIEPAEAAPAAT